jgi:fatty acid desaturase
MQITKSKLTQILAGAALLAGAYSLPAAAAVQYPYSHHRIAHRTHHPVDNNVITVRKRAQPEPIVAAPDAFHNGPATIITAPVAIAGTIVSLPFRIVEAVFPPRTNDPRVVVGAPVHLAGQIAGFPFYAINGAFGVQSVYY